MIAEITGAIGAIKTASDAVRFVYSADKALSVAEFKVQLADAMGALAEAKMQMVNAQDAIAEKDVELRRLNEALENRAKVARDGDGYYELDAQGRPSGPAYCMRCFQVDHSLRSLTYPYTTDKPVRCPACRAEYASHRVRRLNPDP